MGRLHATCKNRHSYIRSFQVWPLLTLNNIWLHHINLIIWMQYGEIYMPTNKRSIKITLYDISCLQGFRNTTSSYSKRTSTSTEKKPALSISMGHPHAKYEMTQWYRQLTRCFTASKLRWPLNSSENKRIHILSMKNMHDSWLEI